jgi:hypothetical protein
MEQPSRRVILGFAGRAVSAMVPRARLMSPLSRWSSFTCASIGASRWLQGRGGCIELVQHRRANSGDNVDAAAFEPLALDGLPRRQRGSDV